MSAGIRWLEGLATQECVFPSPAAGEWQGAPGRVQRRTGGALALNFAPARWLLIGPADSWSAELSAAGALVFETVGKWQLMEVAAAHTAVHAALDLHSTLEGRECAAAVMFDTPVVLARGAAADQLLVCVPASYAVSFADSFDRWAESAT
jgi:hypothetical protein